MVTPLVAALEAVGWSVWWDPEITPGEEFDSLISRELEGARSLVVVWTPNSVDSRWVRGEARDAADRGVLFPVRFNNAKLPIDFRAVHTTDLDGWGEDRDRRTLPRALQGARDETRRAEEAGAGGRGRGTQARGEHLRAAVRQHERRPRAGVLLRRHHRGHHHRPRQGVGAVDRLAQHGLLVQGRQGRRRRDRPADQGRVRAGRQRAQGRAARADHGAAGECGERGAGLGRALRPRPERHLRAAGRDLEGHRLRTQAHAAAGGEARARAARDDQRQGIQAVT